MMDKSTDELLKILKNKREYGTFFSEQSSELYFGSAAQYLEILLHSKGLNKSEVIKRGNLDRNYAYQIFNGTKKNPSRNKVIMIAIGMDLTLDETQTLLKMCGLTELYVRILRDSIIIHSIETKM